jgi:hypothetical protein
MLCGFINPAGADTGEFLLVRRTMQVQSIRLTAIDEQFLIHLPKDRPWERVPIEECIALLNIQAAPATRTTGVLTLIDGQRLPGEAVMTAKSQGDTMAWSHPWLGRIDVPVKQIDSIVLVPDAQPPPPGQGDVVLLVNGDRQDGLITAMGNPLSLEGTGPAKDQSVQIPLNLVAAITMVASKHAGPSGRRVWFANGTVIDVQSIAIGDDGLVRMTGSWLAAGTQSTRVGLGEIAAILFDPKAMLPLARLTPSRVEGPSTRFVLPRPMLLDEEAALNLSRIEYRGPLIARYALPPGYQRFVAEAELPRESRDWGDFEIIVRSDDQEVFRTRVNAANPSVSINAPIIGRELTLELAEGAHGPIQDHLILTRAMLLKHR